MRSGSWRWEAHENYQKGGWRNRCRIASANGPVLLSVPLAGGKHRQQSVRAVRIDHRSDWQRQHEQSLRSAYGRAPYFEFYAEEVFRALHRRETFLWDYNWHIARELLSLLRLPVDLGSTGTFAGADGTNAPDPSGLPSYPQVFTDRFGFVDGLSILDALFCLGPEFATLAARG